MTQPRLCGFLRPRGLKAQPNTCAMADHRVQHQGPATCVIGVIPTARTSPWRPCDRRSQGAVAPYPVKAASALAKPVRRLREGNEPGNGGMPLLFRQRQQHPHRLRDVTVVKRAHALKVRQVDGEVMCRNPHRSTSKVPPGCAQLQPGGGIPSGGRALHTRAIRAE